MRTKRKKPGLLPSAQPLHVRVALEGELLRREVLKVSDRSSPANVGEDPLLWEVFLTPDLCAIFNEVLPPDCCSFKRYSKTIRVYRAPFNGIRLSELVMIVARRMPPKHSTHFVAAFRAMLQEVLAWTQTQAEAEVVILTLGER